MSARYGWKCLRCGAVEAGPEHPCPVCGYQIFECIALPAPGDRD